MFTMNKYKQLELRGQFTAKEFSNHSFIIHLFESRKYNVGLKNASLLQKISGTLNQLLLA